MFKLSNIFLGLSCFFEISCNSQNPTPDQYKNTFFPSKKIYWQNRNEIVDSIKSRILQNIDPYSPKENDSLTKIIVDTVLYDPNLDKVAFFVITQNTNDKLISVGNKDSSHYDAHCFISRLDSSHRITDIVWIRGYNLSNYATPLTASQRIREVFFREITLMANSGGESTYQYNFDDIRFWSGPIWKKYY